MQAGGGERLVGLLHQLRDPFQTSLVSRAESQQAAQVATMS